MVQLVLLVVLRLLYAYTGARLGTDEYRAGLWAGIVWCRVRAKYGTRSAKVVKSYLMVRAMGSSTGSKAQQGKSGDRPNGTTGKGFTGNNKGTRPTMDWLVGVCSVVTELDRSLLSYSSRHAHA